MFRQPTARAALAAFAAAVLFAIAARAAPVRGGRPSYSERPAAPVPAPEVAAPPARLRAIVVLIDDVRARAAAPGLSLDERDALADQAWSLVDEVLADPSLRERARRETDFLQAHALLLMDDGEDEEALEVLERLALIAPDDPETRRLLAECFLGLGRAESAVEEFRRALALDVAASDVRAHLAYALAVAGRLEEALDESARAVAQDPSAYFGHLIRGWVLGKAGRLVEERREYLEAIRRERDDADLWELLARSWERDGETARAREAWLEVVRIDPSDEEAAQRAGGPAPGAPSPLP